MHFFTMYTYSFYHHVLHISKFYLIMYIKGVIKLYITNSLINFLNDSKFLSNSTIILTDLEKVIFVESDNSNNYLNTELSTSLKQIINLFETDINTVDYMNTTLDNIVPITIDDDITKYKSQIILPIIHDSIIDGLLIFIADNRKYLASSLKYAKTTQHFVEVFTTKEYLN